MKVEDSGGTEPDSTQANGPAAKKPARQSPQSAKASKRAPANEERPDPVPSDGGDSDDIGDEIQRIIASYNRNRKKGENG
jgi:hypothetical protein